jgi:predicted membrane channel-forming protein YqfA (hemolysin III family)
LLISAPPSSPALHYGFICHPHLQAAYAAFITVLSVMAMYTVVTPKYRTPAYRPTRTAVFVSLGLSAVVPVGHGLHLYGVRG